MPAATGEDGEYRGTSTRFQADSRSCPRPGLVSVIVYDNRFQYRWDHDTWLNATIGPDGVVEAGDGEVTLHGRLEGSRLEGDATNGPCGFHFTLRKVGT